MSDINESALSLFYVIEPKLDVLVIGIGDKVENYNFYKELMPLSKKMRTSFEVLPTEHACTTFNFLNAEGRNVAAALIPPKHFETTLDDHVESKKRYENLFENRRL